LISKHSCTLGIKADKDKRVLPTKQELVRLVDGLDLQLSRFYHTSIKCRNIKMFSLGTKKPAIFVISGFICEGLTFNRGHFRPRLIATTAIGLHFIRQPPQPTERIIDLMALQVNSA